VTRGTLIPIGAVALTAVVAGVAHGTASGLAVLKYLTPVALVTVVAVGAVAVRVEDLRRQLVLAGAVTAAGVAVAVALFVETMYVSGHDALYTLLVAGYGVIVGAWSASLLGRRALERVEAAERARRDLVAAVSHDLRTPITTLQLLAEAVDDEIVDPGTRRDYLARMRTNVRALSGLIADLFELSRLEAGDIRWSMEQVSVDALLTETVDALRPQADAGGVAVHTELHPALQAARANPEQIQRVLFNLIQNAIRHTPADGSVVVRAEPSSGAIEIEVADTGDGIPASDRDRVFGAFVQVGNGAARREGGAGLGLAIARAIVEAHGGRMWLATGRGGTRIRFRLPSAKS
jgi:signal transduction histidine kinase